MSSKSRRKSLGVEKLKGEELKQRLEKIQKESKSIFLREKAGLELEVLKHMTGEKTPKGKPSTGQSKKTSPLRSARPEDKVFSSGYMVVGMHAKRSSESTNSNTTSRSESSEEKFESTQATVSSATMSGTDKKPFKPLKLRSARGDEEIFSAGFVVGGRVPEKSDTISSEESPKDTPPTITTSNGKPQHKKLRNLKVRTAEEDDQIYSSGFIFGGQRLDEFSKISSEEASEATQPTTTASNSEKGQSSSKEARSPAIEWDDSVDGSMVEAIRRGREMREAKSGKDSPQNALKNIDSSSSTKKGSNTEKSESTVQQQKTILPQLISDYERRFQHPVPSSSLIGYSRTSRLRDKLTAALKSGKPVEQWAKQPAGPPRPSRQNLSTLPVNEKGNIVYPGSSSPADKMPTTMLGEDNPQNLSKKLPKLGIDWDQCDDSTLEVLKRHSKKNKMKHSLSSVPLDKIAELLKGTSDFKRDQNQISFATNVGRTVVSVSPLHERIDDGFEISDVVTVKSILPPDFDIGDEQMLPLFNTVASLSALMRESDTDELVLVSRLSSYVGDDDIWKVYVPLVAFCATVQADAFIRSIESMLENKDLLLDIPRSQEPSRWGEDDYDDAVTFLKERGLFVNGDDTGITVELPWGEDGYAAMMGDITSLLTFQSDMKHPVLGNGLFYKLELPLELPKNDLQILVNKLNTFEIEVHDAPPFFGAWCSDIESGRLSHVGFWPNQIYQRGTVINIATWMIIRNKMAYKKTMSLRKLLFDDV